MRKFVAVLVGACVAGALLAGPAQGAKKKPKKVERVVEVTYDNPSIGVYGNGLGVNYPSTNAGMNENYVAVEVHDAVNPMAGVQLRWDAGGDFERVFVCGATEEPIAIPAGIVIEVWPYIGGDPVGCPGSSATTGSVTLTFSNLP